MGEVIVYLLFEDALSQEQQAEFLERLRAIVAPDFSFEEADHDPGRLRFTHADQKAAMVRAEVVVRGLCDGTDIDPSLIRRSLDSWL